MVTALGSGGDPSVGLAALNMTINSDRYCKSLRQHHQGILQCHNGMGRGVLQHDNARHMGVARPLPPRIL
ncbi:hypothetical protein ANN_19064 [Periplaneta americana]|uniref:Uncharacterized protein n=1 Tax=Periplaneta americana TaxID=6978 RepID=A0ABQ8SRR1_PERAM|nr:hypothetical protein ANN_19064 [Periplaneta americana]